MPVSHSIQQRFPTPLDVLPQSGGHLQAKQVYMELERYRRVALTAPQNHQHSATAGSAQSLRQWPHDHTMHFLCSHPISLTEQQAAVFRSCKGRVGDAGAKVSRFSTRLSPTVICLAAQSMQWMARTCTTCTLMTFESISTCRTRRWEHARG